MAPHLKASVFDFASQKIDVGHCQIAFSLARKPKSARKNKLIGVRDAQRPPIGLWRSTIGGLFTPLIPIIPTSETRKRLTIMSYLRDANNNCTSPTHNPSGVGEPQKVRN